MRIVTSQKSGLADGVVRVVVAAELLQARHHAAQLELHLAEGPPPGVDAHGDPRVVLLVQFGRAVPLFAGAGGAHPTMGEGGYNTKIQMKSYGFPLYPFLHMM